MKYKTLVQKVTKLPVGGITLVPNQEFETEVDLSGYVKVGYLEEVVSESNSAPEVVEDVVEPTPEVPVVEPAAKMTKRRRK